MPYAIDEYFVFKENLFMRGWCFDKEGYGLKFTLELASGKILDFDFEWLVSPDVAMVYGSVAANCRFDTRLSLPADTAYNEVSTARLHVKSNSGSSFIIDTPSEGAMANDEFINIEALLTAVSEYRGVPPAALPPKDCAPFPYSLKVLIQAMKILSPGHILEIGSRSRSGIVRRELFGDLQYTGLDIVDGENVDIVGDAHKLSHYFEPDKFDFIISVSVFEHLLMPWVVAVEMNKVLKTGGLSMVNTHQSWPVHDAPWDFHRFSKFSWKAIFNELSGFEIVEIAMGEPCFIVPTLMAEHYSGLDQQRGYLSSRCIARKVDSSRLNIEIDDLDSITQSPYPA